jgi:hypothetical protein
MTPPPEVLSPFLASILLALLRNGGGRLILATWRASPALRHSVVCGAIGVVAYDAGLAGLAALPLVVAAAAIVGWLAAILAGANKGKGARMLDEDAFLAAIANEVKIISPDRVEVIPPARTSAGFFTSAKAAIASSNRSRSPKAETPISLRPASVSRGSRSASIALTRNVSSYFPRPRPRSHSPTSMVGLQICTG